MTKEALLKTANELKIIQPEHLAEYSKKRDLLIETMNQRMLARPDIEKIAGTDNLSMMKDNHANHARFMESIFRNYSPDVMVDTILWVFRAYMSRGFASTYWAAQLNFWLILYKESLTEDCYQVIYPYYEWMQINIPTFTVLAETEIEAAQSAH